MGRYYHGDIEGKFWFGIQDSRDPVNFGGEEILIVDEEENEGDSEAIASQFIFETKDLQSIQIGLDKCLAVLGNYKEKLDQFFAERNSYSDNELMEYLEFVDEANDIGPTEAMTLTKAFLMIYARHELGLKIKACVEETGKCDFVADWY